MRRWESRMQKGMRAVATALGLAMCANALALVPQLEGKFSDAQTLVLEFPEPMQTWDNEVRGDLVRITPALPAKCAWDDDLRLACHLLQPAADATRYRIDLAAGLKTQAGATLDGRTLTLETVRPQLQARIDRWSHGLPSITLYANMPVDAEAVHSALRLQVDGKSAPLPVLRALPPSWRGDKNVRFEVRLPDLSGEGRRVSLYVQPGLRGRPGPLRGVQDKRLLQALVHEPFALRGVSCAGREERVLALAKANAVDAGCVPGEPVRLLFSRNIDIASKDRIAARIASDMRVSFGWAGDDSSGPDIAVAPARSIQLDAPAPNTMLELVLDSTIRSEDGAELPHTTLRIRAGDAQPQLRAAHGNALVTDGRHPPALLEALNATSIAVDVTGIGRHARNETVQAGTKAQGTPTPLPSAVAARTLADGGWVRWSPEHKQHRYPNNVVEFAAPAFDLQAVAGRREVLAWANEWDRDAPVAGAKIELLWRNRDDAEPRVAARGRTGADGTVLLRLPDDLVIDPPTYDQDHSWQGPSWWLRAVDSNGHRRAVLPAGETSRYYGQSIGRALPRKFWGVSDRPLYRAGDKVHYRLWQRELDGARLRAPYRQAPVKLRLFDSEREKAVLEWQAMPDGEGNLAGELVLPIHLTDATYCIGADDGRGDTSGSCFFVGTYRAQDLWVEAKSRGGVLRDGERYRADVKAGYFSGGSAAGAKVVDTEIMLLPLPLEQAYPQYAGFEFIPVEDDETQSPGLDLDFADELDDSGALHVDAAVKFEGPASVRPAFGVFALDVEVAPEDREGTVAGDMETRYARYDRYVGLKMSPEWFGRSEPVTVEGIVITAQGQSVPADVEVTVDYLTGFESVGGGERLARCVIRTGTPSPCEFPRARSGRYRLTARSGEAAPVQITQYVWTDDGGIHGDVEEAEMTVLDPSPQRETPMRVLVKQPFARARALFVIASGGSILDHRVETLAGNVQGVALPVASEWSGILSLHAYVREAVAAKSKDGYREPVRMESLEVDVPAVPVSPETSSIAVSFEPASTRPGSHARLVLRNDSREARGVTVAVMDDALRAQAQRWLPYADPHGAAGFAHWRSRGEGSLSAESFSEWTGAPWRWLLPWPQASSVAPGVLPPPPEQPSVLAEAPSSVDRPAAAPAPAFSGYGATSLDTIVVTGTRIRQADVIESHDAKAPDKSLPPRADTSATSHAPQLSLLVRTRFADTALWLPDVRLAPGESRSFDVALPDNLTRWRAVAWSSGVEGDFAMTEATIEVGLPVEARLQTPVRLYPGDESRIAANVRHVAASPATARVELQVQDTGGTVRDTQTLRLKERGQASAAIVLHPHTPGTLQVVAQAETSAGRDAVAADIEVASPLMVARKLQAGWIGDRPLNLALPALPAGAQDPQLQVELQRGNAALAAQWTDDLHRYPHRCWEQILSRAVAAALALERHDDSWPDASAVVQEALDNAAVFQAHDGGFAYFPGEGGRWRSRSANIPLTAYSVHALALLQTLGHRVPSQVVDDARSFLAKVAPGSIPDGSDSTGKGISVDRLSLFAFAAAAVPPQDARGLDVLWHYWARLPLPAQVAATQAFLHTGHGAGQSAIERLLQQAPLRGASRSLHLRGRYDSWMSSDLREQCALIGLLGEHPRLVPAATRRELLAGMTDLYAGGVTSVDTQTGAYCLMALRDPAGAANGSAQVRFATGAREKQLQLAPGQNTASWRVGTPAAEALQVGANAAQDVPVSFIARLDYVEDARVAQASAVGFRLERSYDVLHDKEWKPIGAETLREGDWIRITLTLDTTAPRDFVAITDSVPGCLRPTDLELSGVATGDLKRVGDEGAPAFETRRLDARNPRFYAESLPAGRHQVHYFARVGNSGDYLAAPAVAELMYGSATRARTAATRMRIEAREPMEK